MKHQPALDHNHAAQATRRRARKKTGGWQDVAGRWAGAVADGTTVATLFAERMSSRKPADYLIRVNRQPWSADQDLRDGDRISMTPSKIEGAGRAA